MSLTECLCLEGPTAVQLEEFRRQGYLLCPQILSAQQTALLQRWVSQVLDWPEEPGKAMVYYEADKPGRARLRSRVENFVPYHAGLSGWLQGPNLLEIVAALLEEPAVLFKDKINLKLPGGDGFRWHQDVQAGWSDYGSLHLTMMVPVDPCTEQNGLLEVAPGWHDRGLLGPMWEPLSDPVVAALPKVKLPMEPGDIAFFGSYLPHGSGPNLSRQPRRVLYVTYARLAEGDHRERYYADKRASFPPDIERDPDQVYTFKV